MRNYLFHRYITLHRHDNTCSEQEVHVVHNIMICLISDTSSWKGITTRVKSNSNQSDALQDKLTNSDVSSQHSSTGNKLEGSLCYMTWWRVTSPHTDRATPVTSWRNLCDAWHIKLPTSQTHHHHIGMATPETYKRNLSDVWHDELPNSTTPSSHRNSNACALRDKSEWLAFFVCLFAAGFFLQCEDLGRMFNNSCPACTFFFVSFFLSGD